MKLFPPQEEITLYETGFPGDDILERRDVGKQLSDLLEKIEDPLVVALDGPWGCGKTYFLKRWVGAHTIENGGKATTIYFDAFANDFLDDPLIALIGAIGDRLPKDKTSPIWKKIRNATAKLATPASRIGLSVATAGLSELTGPVLDAALAASGKEVERAIDAFWKREDGRKGAMTQFRENLTKLTKESEKGANDGKPLIIVVDELDRCRPDYALSILEVIKHFFSVPHVHFVLGVNLEALEQSVKARYGSGINAYDYLKRFISLSMQLPDFVFSGAKTRASVKYFRSCANSMGINKDIICDAAEHINVISESNDVSLRSIEKILIGISLLPKKDEYNKLQKGYKNIILSLIMFKAIDNNLYIESVSNKITIDHIFDFYGKNIDVLINTETYNNNPYIICRSWDIIIGNKNKTSEDLNDLMQFFDCHSYRERNMILESIEKTFFKTFSVQD